MTNSENKSKFFEIRIAVKMLKLLHFAYLTIVKCRQNFYLTSFLRFSKSLPFLHLKTELSRYIASFWASWSALWFTDLSQLFCNETSEV